MKTKPKSTLTVKCIYNKNINMLTNVNVSKYITYNAYEKILFFYVKLYFLFNL